MTTMPFKSILIILMSCLSLTVFAQQKVAVYVTGEDAGINKVLGSKLISAIARSEQYTAIERTDAILAELSKELKYQQTGAVDDDELSRLGKQFGVRYVCVASVFPAFGEQYISARLIDVETAQVERTASSNGTFNSLDNLISLADELSQSLLSHLDDNMGLDAPKVAVYVVRNDAGKEIGSVLGDQLVAGFTNSGRYVAIERTNSFLAQLSKEQEYQRTGAVDDHDISRLGHQFGVQYVCVADVTDIFGEKFISARLIDVETAEAVNTYETGASLKSLSDCLRMANDIASNLSKWTFAEAQMIAETEAQINAERKLWEEEMERKKEEEEKRISAQKKQELINRSWREVFRIGTSSPITKFSDGGFYIGNIKGGEREGLGLDCWADGSIYIGNFENNNPENMGMYIVGDPTRSHIRNCSEGTCYVGEWKKGNRNGTGTVYDSTGRLIYYGKFFAGKPQGKYPTGGYEKYTFNIVNFDDGAKYVGEMRNGIEHGIGMFFWPDGRIWYGNWSEGKCSGNGLSIVKNGSMIKIEPFPEQTAVTRCRVEDNRRKLEEKVEIQDIQDVLSVTKIMFEFDKDIPIIFDYNNNIDRTVNIMKNNSGLKLVVQCYKPTYGSLSHCIDLAQRRANNVRDHFIHKGVSPDQIETSIYTVDDPTIKPSSSKLNSAIFRIVNR